VVERHRRQTMGIDLPRTTGNGPGERALGFDPRQGVPPDLGVRLGDHLPGSRAPKPHRTEMLLDGVNTRS
jgi:hypothetical protein